MLMTQPAESSSITLPQETIASFVTSKDSVYTYDSDGHTTRYKTVTGIEQPRQDITVFFDMSPRDVGSVAMTYLLRGTKRRRSIEVTEQLPDGTAKIVSDISEVTNPDQLRITTFRRGRILRSKAASLYPRIGAHVYDSRRYDDNGVTKTERHLGHKVTSIKSLSTHTSEITP
jgi:hypothetical protein